MIESDYKIEKNIPLKPRKRDKWKHPSKYPFRIMEIGDSFFVPNYSRDKMMRVSTAGRSYFAKMNKYDVMTVTTRKEGTGFRVWCVARAYQKLA